MNIKFIQSTTFNIFKKPTVKSTNFINFKGNFDTFERSKNDNKRPDFKLDDIKNPVNRQLALTALKTTPPQFFEIKDGQKIFFDEYAASKIRAQIKKSSKVKSPQENSKLARDIALGFSYALESNEIKQLIYNQRKKRNPNAGFLYNPLLSTLEKQKTLKGKNEISSIKKLSEKYTSLINIWADNGLLEYEIFNNTKYIDTSVPFNKNFLDDFDEKRKNAPTLADIAAQYGIYNEKFTALANSGNFDFIYLGGGDCSCLNSFSKNNWPIDMNSENTKKTLERCSKTLPKMDLKHFKQAEDSSKVPLDIIENLGFGNKEEIFQFVQSGVIKGSIVETKNQDGKSDYTGTIDINDSKTEEILKALRNNNKNIVEIKGLAKKLGITIKECEDYFVEKGCRPISNYIFPDDYNKIFINLDNSENTPIVQAIKNKKHLDIVAAFDGVQGYFESEIESSAKMKLIWSFCPKIKMKELQAIASDSHLENISKKLEEGKTLTDEEKKYYMDYCENSWEEEDIEKFILGHKRALDNIKRYKAGRMDAIKNPEVKQMLNRASQN